jgi:hypothetical protein
MVASMVPVGVLGVPDPARAAEIPMPEQAEAERFFVRWLSTNSERAAVRSAARAALSSGGAAEITAFLDTGYAAAVARSEQTVARQLAYAQRMVATHSIQYYPRVNAAGRRALTGTDVELNEFVTVGYAVALELDRQGIADDKLRADLVEQADRAFVVSLRDNDPGPQVRAWAARAVAPGTTDADLAEFLNYGWVSAAGLDLQSYRRRVADADQQWLVQSRRLVTEAQAAESAARGAAAEAQAQLRAAAARAWGEAGVQTSPARVAWADAEQVALRQAEVWLQVSIAAAGATSPHWQTIADSALGTREQWLAEQRHAAEQASVWNALYRQAIEAEAALSINVG